MLDETAVDRALVICAHPDDVDFGAAGTVAAWTDRGIAVTYCLITDGDAGGFDPAFPRSDIGPLRRREQAAAAAAVGVKDLVFLGYPDGRLVASLELRRDLSRVIRQVRPQRVMIQSPVRNLERLFASHPDHLAAGEASICAVYPDARNEFTFTELMAEGHGPWTVAETWIMGGPTPNIHVDVTEHLDRKLDALRAHASQHRDPDGMEARVRGWLAATAAQAGLPEGRSAEAFQVLETG
jgi:LmbE family N-acetylglucosaminyl deacetylase